MTKFTVITITFNAEAVLQRTLDSVFSQTYEDLEHLVIDGASTDGTLVMAEAYKAQSDASASGHKVIVRSEPDDGIYHAMNKGLMLEAAGTYNNVIRILSPLVVTDEQLQCGIEIFKSAIIEEAAK